jgi:5-methylcytosine-specific restriction endonuclease McrA
MKRGQPLPRRTPLRARPSKRSKIPDDVRQAVEHRAGFRCEVSGPHCTGGGDHLHHRLMRSQGGGHTTDNLLLACATDHRYIHSHPEESYQRGWLRRWEPGGSMDKPP